MTTNQDETLTIDSVIRSFHAADAQLRLAAEKIVEISQHEANTARATSGLEASATSVSHLVAQAEEAVRSLRAALDVAEQSLRAGAALLDSAVLTDLQRQIASVDQLVRGIDGRLGNVESATLSRLESIATALPKQEASVIARFDSVAGEMASLRGGAQSQADSLKEVAALVSRTVQSSSRLLILGVGIFALEAVALVLLVTR